MCQNWPTVQTFDGTIILSIQYGIRVKTDNLSKYRRKLSENVVILVFILAEIRGSVLVLHNGKFM